MDETMILDLFGQAIRTILILSMPMLIIALLVGLVIAVFQATTQIQEQTLAFVPKILAIFLMLILAGPWIIKSLMEFTLHVFELIELVAR